MVCSICEKTNGTKHTFREMMFGTQDEFEYWECFTCGCLQIASIPDCLSDYYPDDYYSFFQALKTKDVWWYRAYFKASWLAPLIRRIRKDEYFADGKFQSVIDAKPKRNARILDVGCGAGHLVSVLRSVGFDAHGIDAFAMAETPYIRRATLQDTSGGWNLITFHHSLEHMTDHLGVLRSVREKLAVNGTCLIRIPIAAWAWKQYGKNWVQLDAPRHLVIHTQDSLSRVARAADLEVYRITFDSTIFQFVGSEMYQRNIPLTQMEKEKGILTNEMLSRYCAQAADLNRQQLGDQAAFYLKIAGR